MKKVIVFGILLLLVCSFVFADEAPDYGDIGEEDVEQIEGMIDDYVPIDDEGEFDPSRFEQPISKAEERINKINEWLDENAYWLSPVFGMVPEISWLFAANIFLLLFALTVLVLNGDVIAGYFSVLQGKIDLILTETRWANVFGAGVFIALLINDVFVMGAEFLVSLVDILWNKVLPVGIVVAVIVLVVVVVGFIALLIWAPQILFAIKKVMDERKKKKADDEESVNRKALKTLVDRATGSK